MRDILNSMRESLRKVLGDMQNDYRNMTQSMIACLWALSLFGAEQLARVLVPGGADCSRLQAATAFAAFSPRYMTKMSFEVLQQSADVFTCLMPGRDNRLAWQELKNKLQAFDLFEHVDIVLSLPTGPDISLPELVAQADALGPYRVVWALEGLGRYYAETCWTHKGTPQHLLMADQVSALPAHS